MDKRNATSILDVRERRGVSCGLAHLFLQVKFRFRINRQVAKKPELEEKLDLRKLEKPEMKERFQK